MSAIALSGAHVPLPTFSRSQALTPKQRQNGRNARWLYAYETGMHDPSRGRFRPHTTAEIADLWDVDVRTVQLGIASARRLREAIKRATA